MSDMDAASLGMEKQAVDSSPSQFSFEDSFGLDWDWYIRLKVTFPDHITAADLEANLNRISKEFEDFWRGKITFFSSSRISGNLADE